MRKKRQPVLLALIALTIAAICTALTACGDKNPPPAPPTPVIAVEQSVEVTVGESVALHAVVKAGDETKEGGVFTYESADPTVASVSADGQVRGNKAGTTTVTVSGTYEGATLAAASVAVTVKEQAVQPVQNAEIFVSFKSIRLAVGEEGKQISPVVMDGDRVLSGGSFTYASADPTVATVSDTGLVNPVKKGETKITVSGTYEEKTLTAVELPVEVYETMTITSGIENNALELYSGAGRDTEHPFATSATVTPQVTLSGAAITDATVTLTADESGVVTVSGNTITAAKAGEAKVTVTATSPSGTSESVEITVTVHKPYSTLTLAAKPVISLESAKGVNWSAFGTTVDKAAVTGIKVDGQTVTHAFDGDKLTLADTCATGEDLTMQIETESELFNVQVTVATLTIGTREEFHAFAEKMGDLCDATKTPNAPYVLLTADIDCNDSAHAEATDAWAQHSYAWQWYAGDWQNHRRQWRGVLDGNGHTINDLNIEAAFMFGITEEGVIKNLAITNIRRWGTPRGIVAGELKGTVENCYFHLRSSIDKSDNSWYVPFATQVAATAVVKNVVLSIPNHGDANTQNNYKGKNAVMEIAAGATVENLYMILEGGSGKLTPSADYNKAANGGVYTDVHAFLPAVTANKDKFDSAVWDSDDTLIFQSAKQFFTPESAAGKTVTTSSVLLVGGNAEFTASFAAIDWSLKTPVDGASIENGVLSIGAQVEPETKITVTATGFDPVLGTTYTVESAELTVSGAENIELEGKLVTGANRNFDVLTIDMTDKGITEITSVIYNNEAVTGYALASKVFTLNLKNLPKGDGFLTVSAKSESGTFCNYRKAIEKVDFAIGTADELTGLADAIKAANSKSSLKDATSGRNLSSATYMTAVLTADIDYAGRDFTARTGVVEFVGSLDGRGHTIYNMHGTGALFPSLNGTTGKHTEVKNIAFVRAVVNTPLNADGTNKQYLEKWGAGAWFAYFTNKAIVHDMYIDVTVKNCKDSNFGMYRGTIQAGGSYSLTGNVVANVNYDESCDFGTKGLAVAVTVSQASGFINVYVACNVTPATTTLEGCFNNKDVGVPGNKNNMKYRNLNVHRYATMADLVTALDGALPVLPAIAEKPTAPTLPDALVAPTEVAKPAELNEPTVVADPGEDGSEEDKAAYQAYLTAKEAYDAAMVKYNDAADDTYKEYRDYVAAKTAYDAEKAKFDNENDTTYADYRAALAAYNAALTKYNNETLSENDRFEKAYKELQKRGNGFSADIWQFAENANGEKIALLFKSTVLSETSASSDFAVTSPFTDGAIATGVFVPVSAFRATEWSVTELDEGALEWKEGGFVLADTVEANTSFTVTASFTDIFGTKHEASKTFTVSKTAATVDKGELVYGKNKADLLEVTLQEGDDVMSVTVDGNAVSYTFEGGKLSVDPVQLREYAAGGSYAVKIVATSQTAITEYTATLEVYDFAVATVDEWKAFETAKDANHDANHPLFVVLTADLDFGGDYMPTRKDSDSWYSLNGKGHTIQNVAVTGSHSFLGDVRGTATKRAYVKNVIFKNITQKSGHGGLLCLDAEFVDFENLYIEGTVETTDSAFVAGVVGRDVNWTNAQNFTFTNVVVNVTFGKTNSFNAVVAGSNMALNNVYAISSTSNGTLGGVTVEGSKAALYTTAAEFVAAKADIALGDAWTLTDTELKLFGTTVLTFAAPAQN